MPFRYKAKDDKFYKTIITNEHGQTKTVRSNIYSLIYILNRMKKGYSPIISICGEQRDGKSLFGLWFAHTIMNALSKDLCFDKNYVYDANDATRKFTPLKNEVYVLDEAGYAYYKQEWWDRQHRVFSKILITQGKKVICYIFISPFVNDIDKAFVKHFNILVEVKKRGFAKVFRVIKKHRSFKVNENRIIHMDDISLNLGDIPKHIRDEYERKSAEEKNKIEKRLDGENKKAKEKDTNVSKILRRV